VAAVASPGRKRQKHVKTGGLDMTGTANYPPEQLAKLADVFKKIKDPRAKRGVRHDFHGMVALIFLGLLARMPYIAHVQRWAKRHWKTLQQPLGFKRTKPPVDTTFSRNLANVSVAEFQAAMAEFLNVILMENNDQLVAAVDGKVAKAMPDQNGDPLYMLHVFVHNIKVTLEQWSVRGDKTNEPGCLKKHLEELFETYPGLQLLTGDAIFAQRPLLKALKELGRDYLFQVKENQGDAYEATVVTFSNADTMKPDDESCSKKREKSRSANYGATLITPSMSATN
jgi:hypothetical protein